MRRRDLCRSESPIFWVQGIVSPTRCGFGLNADAVVLRQTTRTRSSFNLLR